MTDDLKEQLLPCPYCAGEAHIYTTSQDSDTSVTAQCKECGAEMNFWLPWTAGDGQKAQAWQDVMNRWNTRAPDPRITDLEARLAAAVEVQDRLMSERYQQYLRAEAAEANVNRLQEGEARLSLLLNETAQARDAAEAGEDALAGALRGATETLRGASRQLTEVHRGNLKGRVWGQMTLEIVSAALAAYEARREK